MDYLNDRNLGVDETDTRTLVNLLTEQIEFANVIVVNKTDLLSKDQVGELKAVLKKMNPKAKVFESNFSKIDPKMILNTGLFNQIEAEEMDMWQDELKKEHTPETEEYGISSFVFRNQKPFHPERFWKYINADFPASIIRSKGLFWLASRPNNALNWSQAGGSLRAENAGYWWASMSFSERINHPNFIENKDAIEKRWHKDFGDRQNEIVIIGQELNQNQITQELEKCLCNDNELIEFKAGKKFKDPFPIQ